MSEIAEQAEFFALVIEYGLHPPEDAVDWACELLVADDPPAEIVELAGLIRPEPREVIEVLRRVPGTPDNMGVCKRFFAHLSQLLKKDDTRIRAITTALEQLASDGLAPVALAGDCRRFRRVYWNLNDYPGGNYAAFKMGLIEFLEAGPDAPPLARSDVSIASGKPDDAFLAHNAVEPAIAKTPGPVAAQIAGVVAPAATTIAATVPAANHKAIQARPPTPAPVEAQGGNVQLSELLEAMLDPTPLARWDLGIAPIKPQGPAQDYDGVGHPTDQELWKLVEARAGNLRIADDDPLKLHYNSCELCRDWVNDAFGRARYTL